MHGAPKSLGSVTDIRAQVSAEAGRMLSLARHVGKRLGHHLHQTADTRSLPDETWVETAKWYQRCVVELQRFASEQPDNSGDKPSAADDEAEMELITREQLAKKTPAERREFLQSVEQELAEQNATKNKLHSPSSLTPAPDRWHP